MTRGLVALVRCAGSRRDCGATAVEYAFIAALIAAVVIIGITVVGAATGANFDAVRF